MLAGELGARVIGLDLEAPLIRRAEAYAREAGLTDRIEFRQVTPGSTIQMDDAAIDVVCSCGAFTQIENKRGMSRRSIASSSQAGLSPAMTG